MTSSRTRKKQDQPEPEAVEPAAESAPELELEATAAEGEPVSRDEAIRKSSQEAFVILRDRYLDEYNTERQRIIRGYGHEWSPPLTERQKKEQQIREAIAADPDLARQLLAEQSVSSEEA